MSGNHKSTDKATHDIETLLNDAYRGSHGHAKIRAYRWAPNAIRIRIIDPDFRDKSRTQRTKAIWPILEALPEDVFAEITMLLLLTPEEAKTSLVNVEFEDPSPSLL